MGDTVKVFKKLHQIISYYPKYSSIVGIPPSRLWVWVGVVYRDAAAFVQSTLTCRHTALPRTKRVLIQKSEAKVTTLHYLKGNVRQDKREMNWTTFVYTHMCTQDGGVGK